MPDSVHSWRLCEIWLPHGWSDDHSGLWRNLLCFGVWGFRPNGVFEGRCQVGDGLHDQGTCQCRGVLLPGGERRHRPRLSRPARNDDCCSSCLQPHTGSSWKWLCWRVSSRLGFGINPLWRHWLCLLCHIDRPCQATLCLCWYVQRDLLKFNLGCSKVLQVWLHNTISSSDIWYLPALTDTKMSSSGQRPGCTRQQGSWSIWPRRRRCMPAASKPGSPGPLTGPISFLGLNSYFMSSPENQS